LDQTLSQLVDPKIDQIDILFHIELVYLSMFRQMALFVQ
jgi:hypothetical protein